ncbi:MAG: glycosyltransferase [Oscillospiraceae bacterium]|nr:glycosyltransferase [Oscillospiraceae bacterium]
MKKVLFLIPNLGHGGAEKVLVNLANNLDRKKFDVTVQTLFDVGVNRQYLKSHVHYIPGAKKQFRGNTTLMKFFSPERLYRRIVKGDYDILVSYLEGPTSRIISGCTDPEMKRVAWVHIELADEKLASVGFRSPDEATKAYADFDRIIAVSERVKELFEKSLGLTGVQVLYNTNETEEIIEKSKISPDDPRFLTDEITLCSVAKLVHPKGFDRLLEAHRRLLNEGYPHRVYILGVGELQGELEKKIKEYSLEKSFILLGYKDNPYQYVGASDLYVCSSRREGFSTAVTEALIVGTPVVSTDCSGAKELLGENNEYGIVTENSAEGVYAVMKKMLSNPELLRHYREKAVERGKYFSREKTVKAVEEMLESL